MIFKSGDTVMLIDSKNRKKTIVLDSNKTFYSHSGAILHSTIIGNSDASIVETDKGKKYLAISPLLRDFVLTMPRGAAVIYPKDAAVIVAYSDIKQDSKVLEAGVGSGSLSTFILKALGPNGSLTSYETRSEFAEIAKENVKRYFGEIPENWKVVLEDVKDAADFEFTHIILDMLSPWLPLARVSELLEAGGVLCTYVATTTQMSEQVEAIRASSKFTEPEAFEIMIRTWHLDGLAVRPDHRMPGHTGFLIFARKMATGSAPLVKRRKFNSINVSEQDEN